MKIEEKIKIARDLHAGWADTLRADPALARGLEELCARAEESGRASGRVGISDVCRRCDQEEGGSCCGAGIEDRYTPELLLLNLLLGAEIPDVRRFENSCHFLGERGCLLTARDIICINYLCARVRRESPEDGLAFLQETTGREMDALFILHDKVRKKINGSSNE